MKLGDSNVLNSVGTRSNPHPLSPIRPASFAALEKDSCRVVRFCSINMRPKSCSAASALCARHRRVRFTTSCSPPSPKLQQRQFRIHPVARPLTRSQMSRRIQREHRRERIRVSAVVHQTTLHPRILSSLAPREWRFQHRDASKIIYLANGAQRTNAERHATSPEAPVRRLAER